MPPLCQSGRWKHHVFYVSVRSFVRLLPNWEHDILETNKPILMQIYYWHKWSTGQEDETINIYGHDARGQGHTSPKLERYLKN